MLGEFLSAGECVIGSQLHPWVNPPFDETVDSFNSFPGNLSRSIERAKIAALSEAITRNFGARPIVYRAGRYGIGPNSEALLASVSSADTTEVVLRDSYHVATLDNDAPEIFARSVAWIRERTPAGRP